MNKPTLCALLLLAACGGGGGDGPDADLGPDAAPDGPSRGAIRVAEYHSYYDTDGTPPAEEGRTGRVDARFTAGVDVGWHTETQADGACRLLEYHPGFCQDFCDGVCTSDDVCMPWPTYVSAGAVTLSGLKASITMTPDTYGYYYPPGTVPEDLFDAGDAITATAPGADLPALTLHASGVTALVAGLDDGAIVLTPAQDRVVTWTPSGDPGARVRLTLNSNNQGHGLPYLAIIQCDIADAAGAVTIPAAMIDAFPATENWSVCAGTDCPRSSITRYSRGTVGVPDGQVALEVASVVEFGVVHRP